MERVEYKMKLRPKVGNVLMNVRIQAGGAPFLGKAKKILDHRVPKSYKGSLPHMVPA